MIFPQKMIRLSAVILSRDLDDLTRRLLNLGVMDFIGIKELDPALSSNLSEIKQKISGGDISDLRRRIEMFLETAGLAIPGSDSKTSADIGEMNADDIHPVDVEALNLALEGLSSSIHDIREKQKTYQQEIHRNGEIRRQVALFDEIPENPSPESSVQVLVGLVKKSRMDGLEKALSAYPVVLHKGEEADNEYPLMLLFMRRDQAKINLLLDRFQWQTMDIPPEFRGAKDQILIRVDQNIASLKEKQMVLQNSVKDLLKEKEVWLTQAWNNLKMNELYIQMQDCFGKTSETVLFSGWIPLDKHKQVEEIIRETTLNRCYLDWFSPGKDGYIKPESVPVKLSHKGILRPFQWVVENYSEPEYGSIDPTIIVAVSFLIMFGLMFGDAGHGLVLGLIGGLIAIKTRVKKGTIYELGRLVVWCGGASIVTGILFGSYFGHDWFPALWFDYHGIVSGHGDDSRLISDINDILGITLKFGIGVIGTGILLNIIHRFRSKDWIHLFFDKGGLLGGWFYAGGVYTAFYFVGNGYQSFPPTSILFWLVLLPLAIFIVKSPLEFFLHSKNNSPKKFKGMKIVDWIMDWIVELLELFSGYLSNTLSFMRIAGLGIAHVSLMTAFFQIAGMTSSPIFSAVILIFGNALVIALEGFSAGVQSLRLNYYEFFSKYFCGSGKVYEPVSLRRNK